MRVTRQTRYALAGATRHKPKPVTITYPDGRVMVIEPLARKREGLKHKPAKVAKVEPVANKPRASTSLFSQELRERLAGLGGYAPESYL